MKENGVRPGGKIVHNLIMGSIINGRRDLAEAFAEEFRYNGIKYELIVKQHMSFCLPECLCCEASARVVS